MTAPDRFKENARELTMEWYRSPGRLISDLQFQVAAALRAVEADALERAAQEALDHGDGLSGEELAEAIRALIPPAAAPAAEVKVLRHVTPRAKIVGNYICEKCEHHDHSDHIPGWGGICVGCACEWLPPSEPAAACTCRYLNGTRFENYGNCPVHPSEPVAPAPSAAEKRIAELERVIELSYPFVAEGDENTTVDGLTQEQIVRHINSVMRAATPSTTGETRIAELKGLLRHAAQYVAWRGVEDKRAEALFARIDAALAARAATQKGEGK